MFTYRPVVLSPSVVRSCVLVGFGAIGALAMLVGLIVGAASMLLVQGARGVCATEDSPSCVWIAPVQGNHRGRPVIGVNGPAR